jgi:DNA mismatch endonuclease (patch repair protein)
MTRVPAESKTFHVPSHPGAINADLSKRMSGAARRDTAPELALRRELHRRGRRYRVVVRVPGRNRRTIDIAFTRAKLAVFIDGCFWHGCPVHGTTPTHNSGWWTTKLAANYGRDRDTDEHLAREGWAVLRIWEHVPAVEAADQVEAALEGLSALRRPHAREQQQPEDPGTAGEPSG